MSLADLSRVGDFGDVLDQAVRDAAGAAEKAGVRIIEANDERATRLISTAGELVWGPRGTFAPNEMRALAFSGNPVHLAVDAENGATIGFAVGFLGWAPQLHVHSHQAGVVASHRRRGVGYALKLAQRLTCLAHGIAEMRWTFDPLVRRNTAFNLNALGARAVAFYPDFYGIMTDSINTGDASDRLEAVWDLTRPLPTTCVRPAAGPTALKNQDGMPARTEARPVDGAVLEVPADYEAIRAQEPERSRAWRLAVREVLADAYRAGLRVGAVSESGYLLVANVGPRQ
jgi:predicted GNAT superfamily acetyltransferase